MDRTPLTPDQLQKGIAELSRGWSATADGLVRKVEFPTFLTAVEFISELAPVAERLDHHPDLRLSWRTVDLTLTTHSAGGVTQFDLVLAHELDELITRLTG
jgi:4a-hydroxytetrahydrobiopterin dehydratase